VAGVVALLLSAYRELRGHPGAVLGLLAATATQFVDTACNLDIANNPPYNLTLPNNTYGYGFIQVDKALKSKWRGDQ
jgi:hypothetical protein